jgi:hypothetical protein
VTVRSIEPGSDRVRCEGRLPDGRKCVRASRWIVDLYPDETDVSFLRKWLCGECMARARDGAGAGE